MRSIRFALLAYFLVLLATVLAAVSFYVYEENRSTLAAKERSMEELLQARLKDEEQAIHEKLDDELLRQANMLASLAHAQWKPPPLMLPSLTALSVGPLVHAPVPALYVALGEDGDNSLAFRIRRINFPEIQFAENVVFCPKADPAHAYFQVSGAAGLPLQRSASLAGRTLPLRPQARTRLELFESSAEDLVLEGGTTVRCVTLRAPVTRQRIFFPNRPPGGGGNAPSGGGRVGTPSRPRDPARSTPPAPGREVTQPALQFFDRTAPVFFFQCARSTEDRDQAIAAAQARKDQRLDRVRAESVAALASLRLRLALLVIGTIIATGLGVAWLIRRGLAPVNRISQAVSEVSEKDFQLHLDQRDVPSELRPVVDRLKYSLDSLGKAFTREKQAAADISHELRTPISALLATTQVCLRKARTPEEYRLALQSCRDIGQQLSGLVERLLTLARLDAGADKLRPEAVDVPELADQCVQMVRPLAESRDLKLTLERNGPIVVETDPDKLREVLTNLLHNAIQYNRPKGSINVSIEHNNGHAELAVRDTGIGISPEAKEHLFERFYRVDPSRQSDTVHAGLGLAIVKGYLDLMGAKIEIDSVKGEGSTFRVLLPVEDQAKAYADREPEAV